jgi:hypothetical protein
VLITVAILNVCDLSLFAKTKILLFGRLQADDKKCETISHAEKIKLSNII